MTRTGRVYTREHLGGSSKDATTRQPIIETGPDDLWRKVQAKEYSVIDHLNKVPTQISILSLLQNSEAHKNLDEKEALAGLKDLFLEDEDMDCSAIIEEEEEEEEGLSIQTVEKGAILRNWTATPSRARQILRKDAETSWTEDCQKAFDKIKEYLSIPPVLVLLEPGQPLLLYLSVLDGAFGCILGQYDETGRKEQAIYYLIKGQELVDHLTENPVGGEYEPLKTYVPNEEVSFVGEYIMEAYDGWRMFFDGAANFKGVGIVAVLISDMGQHYPVSAKPRFPCTNNMVEYEACILWLNMAVDMNIQELLVISDSDFLVHQVQGKWATKNSKILPYLHHVQELKRRFTKIEFRHVPRIQNELADALATLSSMIQHPNKNYIDPIPVRIYNQLAYCAHVEEEADGKPWFYDIKEYLSRGEYPEHANHIQKRTLQRLSNHFFHSRGSLYRRTLDLGLLRCIDAKEASKLLEDVYTGTCGPHMNSFILAKKILRAGYF
ncbi:uncharacterized protein [Nicotiana sylvestris]|uniref:uncharacterized protein n=1 Tax=Nicotiana sylvestris TaxID=4096 RepID=UPI00388C7382